MPSKLFTVSLGWVTKVLPTSLTREIKQNYCQSWEDGKRSYGHRKEEGMGREKPLMGEGCHCPSQSCDSKNSRKCYYFAQQHHHPRSQPSYHLWIEIEQDWSLHQDKQTPNFDSLRPYWYYWRRHDRHGKIHDITYAGHIRTYVKSAKLERARDTLLFIKPMIVRMSTADVKVDDMPNTMVQIEHASRPTGSFDYCNPQTRKVYKML